MKRIYMLLAIAAFATVAIPSYANNWQWQLDRIKSAQQRQIDKNKAQLQARLAEEKMTVSQLRIDGHMAKKPANTSPVN